MKVRGYIPDIQQHIEGERVLDIGCLGSYEGSHLKRHDEWKKVAKEIIGIDIHKEFLALARAKGTTNIYHYDITDSKEATSLREAFGQFDHIIATDVMEHIGNLTSFLDGVRTLMTDKSTFYLVVPNARSLVWQKMWDGSKHFLYNDDHVCWFDIDTLRTLLGRSGLKISRETYCWHHIDIELAKQHKFKWQPSFGRKLYLHVRKD